MPFNRSFGEQNRESELAMQTQRTLVVASDGSDDSVGALIVARELATRFGFAMELVSVLEPAGVIVPPLRSAPPPLHPGATRVQDRRERLQRLCERTMAGEPRCSTRLLIGDVSTSIATAATSHHAELVVTGRVAHGRIERAIRRETPLATARDGPVPVLAVPPTSSKLPRVVVVALRDGRAAARVGSMARALFHEAVAIHLVTVEPLVAAPWERDARVDEDELTHRTQRVFADVMASWKLPSDIPLETHVLTGDESAALAAFVKTVGADLLVVGAGRRRLPGADLATKLYRAVSCATLLVPVQEPAALRSAPRTSISLSNSEWPTLLRHFGTRNGGRRASLTIDQRGGPPHAVVRDWMLSGVDCDPDVEAVSIMLADPDDPQRHLSHVVSRPSVLAIHGTSPGSDDILVIGYADGQLTLDLS
jgi:nucleotide-binding universal stress UspA family protein